MVKASDRIIGGLKIIPAVAGLEPAAAASR